MLATNAARVEHANDARVAARMNRMDYCAKEEEDRYSEVKVTK